MRGGAPRRGDGPDLLHQALAVEHLATAGGTLAPGVHAVPPSISDRVARHKLRALGVRFEELTDRQLEYLSGWRAGT